MGIIEQYNNFEDNMSRQLSQLADTHQIRDNIKTAAANIDNLVKYGYIDSSNTDYEYLQKTLERMKTSAVTNINNVEGIREHYKAYSNIEDICHEIKRERDEEDGKQL